ncbi:hypothetical protein [Pedobacter faecalis]|uniref:hypothetical protein n=1 Tax=Pedobacter faecalis TaxID=3041495 RepID=UPI00254D7443|nr:hypothetical protein [Pedobacter sp. ELA7]
MGGLLLSVFRKGNYELTRRVLVFTTLVLIWPLVQRMVLALDVRSGYVDPGIVVLIVISMLCFLMVIGMSLWLLKGFLIYLGLPSPGVLALKIKEMDVWVQLSFYLACFALLLFAGVGCLAAVL